VHILVRVCVCVYVHCDFHACRFVCLFVCMCVCVCVCADNTNTVGNRDEDYDLCAPEGSKSLLAQTSSC